MDALRAVMVTFLASLLTLPAGADTAPVSLGERALLQATMQRHIDAALVGGRYLHLDTRSGAVKRLRPVAAHPKMLRMGPYYVLCATFRSEADEPANVDFYLAREGDEFVVFASVIEDRAFLKRMLKSGAASFIR